jgi:hypothetical protein
MSQEKIYVYCFKSEILRMPGSVKLHINQGAQWIDPEVVELFPRKFKPARPPEDVDETPSDADDDAQVDPGDDGEVDDAKVEPDGSDGNAEFDNPQPDDDQKEVPVDDEKVDPPADPLAEALAEVEDLQDNKKKLEAYGRKFGIELNRRKSLKNMKADLAIALTELMSE